LVCAISHGLLSDEAETEPAEDEDMLAVFSAGRG
jgi:hypothetical protein